MHACLLPRDVVLSTAIIGIATGWSGRVAMWGNVV